MQLYIKFARAPPAPARSATSPYRRENGSLCRGATRPPNFPNKVGARFIASTPGCPDQSDQSDCLPGWSVKPAVRVPVFMGVFVEKCGAFVHY